MNHQTKIVFGTVFFIRDNTGTKLLQHYIIMVNYPGIIIIFCILLKSVIIMQRYYCIEPRYAQINCHYGSFPEMSHNH